MIFNGVSMEPCKNLLFRFIAVFLAFHRNIVDMQSADEKPGKGELSIIIKDDGIVELVKGEVAIIFYLTVSNVGHEPLHLLLNCKKCCQKFGTSDEEDCESMKPLGGDMGELYPQDTRNLTMIYPTLYAHDRVGSCDVEIISSDGKKMERAVKFNTTLPRGVNIRVPRLLEQYYDPDDVVKCSYVDEDPLNLCRPADCESKYTGSKNFFNRTTRRCEELPRCVSETKGHPDRAYLSATNVCHDLKTELTEEEKSQFLEGKPGAHQLKHQHRYPMNLICHEGTLDVEETRCVCKKGWASAMFDPATFNFDVQAYHMCTIWTGELSAQEAENITFVPKDVHAQTGTIVFSTIAACFAGVAVLLGILFFWKQSRSRRTPPPEDEEGESIGLITTDQVEESD